MVDDNGERFLKAALEAPFIVTTTSDAISVLKSGADISHRQFQNSELDFIEAVQSLFNGVVFKECVLRHCNFGRSDFEGARFERCKIYKSSFDNSDFRSTTFFECMLDHISMNDAHISDNLFIRCEIKSSSFIGSTLLSNRFESSIISSIYNSKATIMHSIFNKSTLVDVKLADCTFLFNIFDKCKFENFTINADALGLTYGISPKDLALMGVFFLGLKQDWPDAVFAGDAIIESFKSKRWPLHLAFSRLFYSDLPRVDAWRFVFEVIACQIELRRGLTLDEVQFTSRVASRLMHEGAFPFAAAIYGYDRLNGLSFSGEDPTSEKQSADLLLSDLTVIVAKMHDNLVVASVNAARLLGDKLLVAEFVFSSQPAIDPSPYLLILACSESDKACLLASRSGSWIQPIQLISESLINILVALYLLEGCIIQLTKVRARALTLFSKNLPRPYLEDAKTPKQEISPLVQKALKSFYSSYLSGGLPSPPRDSNLTSENLVEIRIKKAESHPKASRSRKTQSR